MFNIVNCKALLNELKCKQCSNFLSVLPVYYCSAIGNVCGRCTSAVDWMISNGTLERAVAYEAVAKFLIFPCKNSENGCQQKLRVDEVEEHEKICGATSSPCPFNVQLGLTSLRCDWKGTAATVTSHLHAEHKDHVQVGLPSFLMNVYDTHVKNFIVTIEDQMFLVISKYSKELNKFYLMVMSCYAEPKNQCYRYQLEIGRQNDYFLIFRKPNLERFGNVQDVVDNPENMISINVSSILTMLDDSSEEIYYKVSIFKKAKKEIDSIMGQLSTPTPPSKDKPNDAKVPQTVQETNESSSVAASVIQPVDPKDNLCLPKLADLKVGEPSKSNTPPVNLNPKKKFMEELECPICNQYMTPPIYICPTGHSLCNRCKVKLNACPLCRATLQDTRNFTLENLTATVQYPCYYSDKGCSVRLHLQHIKMHELNCNFAYAKCPLQFLTQCNIDNIVDVAGHIRSKHSNLYVATNMEYARDIEAKITTSYWATCHENEIFLICCKHSTTTGPVKFNVVHVSASKAKKKYRFCLEFSDQTNNSLKFIISQLCKMCPQNPSEALKNCLTIPIDMLKPFIKAQQKRCLYFKVLIEKV